MSRCRANAVLAAAVCLAAVAHADAATYLCRARQVGMLPRGQQPPAPLRVEAETLEAAVLQARPVIGAAMVGCQRAALSADEHGAEVARMQQPVAPPAGARAAGAQAPFFVTPGFNAASLNMETEVTAIYLGDFEHARLDRTGVPFSVLLGSFIQTYFRRCGASLPADKVELPENVCARERYPTRNGIQVGAATCVEYRAVPSGVFTTPDLHAAKLKVEESMVPATAGAILTDIVGTTARTLDASAAVGGDMDALLQQNGCTGAGIQRFQDNLARFGLGRQALRLPGGATLETARVRKPPDASAQAAQTAQTVFKDADYAWLLDDLIVDNAQSWMMNRYDRRSVRDVSVLGRDAQGRPQAIYAEFGVTGPNGRPARNGVKLVFAAGVPSCLYFNDMPQTCRSAGRRIVTEYEGGHYTR